MIKTLLLASAALYGNLSIAVANTNVEDLPKCEIYKKTIGAFDLTVKKDRFSASPVSRKDLSLYLWFNQSMSPSDHMTGMIGSEVAATPTIKEKEILEKNIGETVTINLAFDDGEFYSLESPLESIKSRNGKTFFFRWDTLMTVKEAARVREMAKASSQVTVSVSDSQSGAILRQETHSLDGLAEALKHGYFQRLRIERAEPPFSCSRF